MSVEFTSPAGAQYIDFGSAISGVAGITSKTISCWVYSDDVSVDGNQTFVLLWDGTGTDADEFWEFYPALAQIRLSAHFNTTNGVWRTGNVLTVSTWHHVVVSYNAGATTNDPVFYVDGVSKSVTELSTPVGTYQTGTTGNLYVGQTTNAYALDGKIADVRIYNSILTSSQVAALYAAGVFTPNFDSNLVFHAPLNNCTALGGSTFDGFTLTSSQLFSDRIGCVQGTPSGSPLGSSTNPS